MNTDLNIEIKTKMIIDRSTAEACLKIVEMYLNSTNFKVDLDYDENGDVELKYV